MTGLSASGSAAVAGADHVIYKLYVDPAHRGRRVGPRLLQALIAQLPEDAERVFLEHFAANQRAGAFYEREGFVVDRVEPAPDPALAVVWRVRDLPAATGNAGRSLRFDVIAVTDAQRWRNLAVSTVRVSCGSVGGPHSIDKEVG